MECVYVFGSGAVRVRGGKWMRDWVWVWALPNPLGTGGVLDMCFGCGGVGGVGG